MKIPFSSDVMALNPGLEASLTVEADQKAAKRARVPRAPSEAPTGLSGLITRGWSVQSPDSIRYRLHQLHTGRDTGLCTDEAAACRAAKALETI